MTPADRQREGTLPCPTSNCPRSYVPQPSWELSSNELCPTCGYPFFWAPESGARAAGDGAPRLLGRQTGERGLQLAGSFGCPHCGEQNDPDPDRTTHCVECGELLRPVSEGPRTSDSRPERTRNAPVQRLPWWREWWMWIGVGVCAAIVAVIWIVALVD